MAAGRALAGRSGAASPFIGPVVGFRAIIADTYNRQIVELAARIPRLGHLAQPDATATAHSRLSGSTVTVELNGRCFRSADAPDGC
jgi:hypothetical protein